MSTLWGDNGCPPPRVWARDILARPPEEREAVLSAVPEHLREFVRAHIAVAEARKPR